ncbi:sigma-54-dependent Fis family transcriptional regulator [Pseudomonas sp. JM0905a]|uniref:sigma-54-dependent Fis family transcriptional regulator n=1 Tax=Pseudomonas sp. JM0905a TaxID=2772484 RepID=UPI0016825F4B|nr:sigma-54-dependent Fis family transcriptional regulator [Pseudomonas sp. JM0905a]MBD2837846.1 sigma-54-dependent Fis family transcriptional regulator [Pseudomonas sp. JM0905a]
MNIHEHNSRILAGVEQPASDVAPSSSKGLIVRDSHQESWRRCFEQHQLDPKNRATIPQVGESQLRQLQDEFGHRIFSYALEELNSLMSMVNEVGYSASLANSQGVIIAESVKPSQEYYCESDRLGSIWLEEVGGTNGIGTSIIEQRPVAVFKDDHFYYDFAAQACVAAPFYDPMGNLQGVLNLTTCNPYLDINAHHIVYKLACQSSVQLEERLFLEHFQDFTSVRIRNASTQAFLVAYDDLGVIRGASMAMRKRFAMSQMDMGRRFIWEIFDLHKSGAAIDQLRSSDQVRLLDSAEVVSIIRFDARRHERNGRPNLYIPDRGEPVVSRADKPTALDACAGNDGQMKENVRLVRKIMNKGLPIMLLGETGVGKDTLAKAIHQESDRRDGPFVAFNCAAVPESLIDSELFGYGKGAFTGANREGNQGRLVEAHGGTLFLDEIGDMPLVLQTRLLRVLESGEVSPLGSGKPRHVDLQVIAATNQRLHDKVAEGSFREDLFFRLAGVIVNLPPLRQREDKDFIIKALLADLCRTSSSVQLTKAAEEMLMSYSWPGNVREMKHVLHRASLLCDDGVIDAKDISLPFQRRETTPSADRLRLPSPSAYEDVSDRFESPSIAAKMAVAEAEGKVIAEAMAANDGNVEEAAKTLGMSRATLYRKLKKYGIKS